MHTGSTILSFGMVLLEALTSAKCFEEASDSSIVVAMGTFQSLTLEHRNVSKTTIVENPLSCYK